MDHLVLCTPENLLPAALREKKEMQRSAQAGDGGAGVGVKAGAGVPRSQNAFLAPPIVVLPVRG